MPNTPRSPLVHLALLVALAGAGGIAAPTKLTAQAEPRSSQQRIRIDNAAVTLPSGESYRVDGGLHLTFHSTRDAAGGLHVKVHANPQGLSAVGGAGGATYRVVGAANAGANVGLAKGAASEGTAVLNLGLIGQGKAPNLRLHVNLHLTVNANGAVTATVANVRLVQQG